MHKGIFVLFLGMFCILGGCLETDDGEEVSSGCTVDEVRCNGDKVEVCNASGLWTTTLNCANGGMVCQNAQCVEGSGVSSACTYRSTEECEALGYIATCADRECIGENGWSYVCKEDGVCEDQGSVDYGDAEANASDYYGVWGGIFVTASRTRGIPLRPYQDSVTVHHLLMRVSRDGDDVVMQSKMCYMQMHNMDEEKVYEVGEDVGQLVIPPAYYDNVATLEHRIEQAGAFGTGATFETDWFWEVRGAELEDHVESDLPDRDDYETYCKPWDEKKDNADCLITDQDGDGKPGMTVIGIGALDNQEAYHDQRWGCAFKGTVLDNDHIEGLAEHDNLQFQLDGSSASMVYDIMSIMHPDEERTYLRMLRMSENATCEDVNIEADSDGSWLEFTAFMDEVNP